MERVRLIRSVAQAMENTRQESYLNCERLEIHYFAEFDDLDLSDEIRNELEYKPENFLLIPTLSSVRSMNLIEGFTEYISNPYMQARIFEILKNRNPMIEFKKLLEQFPEEQINWNQYKEYCISKIAQIWLKDNGIIE